MNTINTSRAKKVNVDIYNYDNIPLSATYTSASVPIDLTDYKIVFKLLEKENLKESYTIEAAELSTTYLEKTGTDTNILNMEAMFEDIQSKTVQGVAYRLVQIVTDPDDKTYVHIVYNINARHH